MSSIYILKLTDGHYYIGSCRDINKRLENHSKGQVKSTKYRLPFKLVYLREFPSYKEAFCQERKIKSWKKRVLIEKLIMTDANNKIKMAPSSNG